MQSIELARSISSEYFYSAGENVSNLTLQKLMYYAVGWSLALENKELIKDEDIQAWEHGPVFPSIYRTYKSSNVFFQNSDNEASELVQLIVKHYGSMRPFGHGSLVELTHMDKPWRDHYKSGIREIVIPKEEMLSFFKDKAIENPTHAQFVSEWLDLHGSERQCSELTDSQVKTIDEEWRATL